MNERMGVTYSVVVLHEFHGIPHGPLGMLGRVDAHKELVPRKVKRIQVGLVVCLEKNLLLHAHVSTTNLDQRQPATSEPPLSTVNTVNKHIKSMKVQSPR